ncbi:MAG: hypothetical protein M3Y54_17785 [Bacteroidota bacterium]|nr:hypothetical protein [Bacteroidota bacterium]
MTTANDKGAPALEALVVSYGPTLLRSLSPDYLLEQRLRTRFYWSARLHDQPIGLRVHHGQVTLTGAVATWLDHKAATAGALACGADAVDNRLRLTATN